MRLFFSLPLPKPVREAALALQEQVMLRAVDWKATKSEQLHLTTLFLGEVTPERVDPLLGSLGASNLPELEFAFGLLGFFPSPRRPSTLVLLLRADPDAVSQFSDALRSAVEPHVSFDAKPFRPHITLARARNGSAVELGSIPIPTIAWSATELELVHSELRPEGAQYTSLHRWTLQTHDASSP